MAYVPKTKVTAASVDDFLDAVPNETRRADGKRVSALLEAITGEAARMWGPSIVGFGRYRYTYESGHSGEICRLGFSPRASSLVFYGLGGAERYGDLLARMGKHKTGKGCVYVNRLADVDEAVLAEVIKLSWDEKQMGEA